MFEITVMIGIVVGLSQIVKLDYKQNMFRY